MGYVSHLCQKDWCSESLCIPRDARMLRTADVQSARTASRDRQRHSRGKREETLDSGSGGRKGGEREHTHTLSLRYTHTVFTPPPPPKKRATPVYYLAAPSRTDHPTHISSVGFSPLFCGLYHCRWWCPPCL